MNKILRFLVCYVISLVAIFLSGYGNFTNNISESLAVTTFFASALILSVIVTLIWEIHLNCKNRISELSERIDKLEAENRKLKKED